MLDYHACITRAKEETVSEEEVAVANILHLYKMPNLFLKVWQVPKHFFLNELNDQRCYSLTRFSN